MSEVDVLDDMICDRAKVQLTNRHGRMQAVLFEPQFPEHQVVIRGLPAKTIVLRADLFRSRENFFKGTKGECRCADFIIVADTGKRTVIVYIEMKKTKGSLQRVREQLLGARSLVGYCKEIGACFWDKKKFLSGSHERYISIGHTSIGKRPTRIERPSKKHDRPERVLKIGWAGSLEFNQIAC